MKEYRPKTHEELAAIFAQAYRAAMEKNKSQENESNKKTRTQEPCDSKEKDKDR